MHYNCIWSYPLYGSNILLYLCYRAYNTSVIVCLFLLVLVVQHQPSFLWFLHFFLYKKSILKCLFVSGVYQFACWYVFFLNNIKCLKRKKNQHVQQLWCINFWNFSIVCHILLTPVSSDVCIWRTGKKIL